MLGLRQGCACQIKKNLQTGWTYSAGINSMADSARADEGESGIFGLMWD